VGEWEVRGWSVNGSWKGYQLSSFRVAEVAWAMADKWQQAGVLKVAEGELR
jgi:hypothetical protein